MIITIHLILLFIICLYHSKNPITNSFRLENINERQEEAGLRNYKPGNILLIHLDFVKTENKFTKKEEHLINLQNLSLKISEM
jgi:hypothetical protein